MAHTERSAQDRRLRIREIPGEGSEEGWTAKVLRMTSYSSIVTPEIVADCFR